jgi:hypothetical protein
MRTAIYGMLIYGKLEEQNEVKDCFNVAKLLYIIKAVCELSKCSFCLKLCGTTERQ